MIDEIKEELFSLRDAAKICNVTKQALYVASRKNRLKIIKKNKRIFVTQKSLNDYRINKYNSDYRKSNGELIFDLSKGHFSIHQVLKALAEKLPNPFPKQRLYYLLRTGQIAGFRKGKAWIIMKEDAKALLDQEMALLEQEKTRIRNNG